MQRKVFLLHGWSTAESTPEKWAPFQEALAARGIESELLRIPGLSAPLDEVWELDDFMAWLVDALRARGVTPKAPAIVLGHSFGGQIATRTAAVHPDLIAGLLLLDAAGIRDHSFLPTLKRRVFLLASKIGKAFFNFKWARTILYTLARERDYNNAPPLLKRTMSNILEQELHADYPRIAAPTQLIWGAEDTVTPPWMGRYMQREIPDASMTLIDAARHSPQYTHPESVAAVVAAFVEQVLERHTSR